MTRPSGVAVHLMAGEEGCRWAREQRAVAVVVDALRASATITVLLQQGASEVLVVKEVEEAYAYRHTHPDTLLVGERGGLKVEGFDFGNSPTEIRRADVRGKPVAFTSTTGAQRLVDCLGASGVVVGTTINASAVAGQVIGMARTEGVPIVIIPAGLATDPSAVADEDWLGATALAVRMGVPIHEGSEGRFQHYHRFIQSAGLLEGFLNSSHGQQLVRLGFTDDIRLCAQVDLITDIVPTLTAVVPLAHGGQGVRLRRGTPEYATSL
jgi:2-phosphosulfolactate phosphatase